MNIIVKKLTCILGVAGLLSSAAQAAEITAFTFETDLSPTTQEANTTTGDMTAKGFTDAGWTRTYKGSYDTRSRGRYRVR